MKKKIFFVYCFLLLLTLSFPTFSQGPGHPYHTMTAPGAKGIYPHYHTLYWENPLGTIYNQIYLSIDSILVSSMDTLALIYNGYPTTIYSSVSLDTILNWLVKTKYYWKIVEYDSTNYSPGPTWDFTTIRFNSSFAEDFNNGLDNWEKIGPNGISNWSVTYSSFAGGTPPELKMNDTPIFEGNSYIMCNYELSSENYYFFRHRLDWFTNPFTIGFGFTSNSGQTWTTLWEISPTGNVGPEFINGTISEPLNDYKVGFYFSGNSYNLDGWYIDDVFCDYILTPPPSPRFLKSNADTSQLKIYLEILNNDYDSTPPDSREWLFQIIRKEGLPNDTSGYLSIAFINVSNGSYTDENVSPNKIYTYRARTDNGYKSVWGNEATAYVPNIVPVELMSFTLNVLGSNVILNWSTATETNNQGFEVQRTSPLPSPYQGEGGEAGRGWEKIGFVPGFGTTTEVHHYSFSDESLQPGKYQYRLKQIDFDGSFEYSNIIEVRIEATIEFSLEQNYPNPFNPTTKIKYSIPSATLRQAQSYIHVTLKVYDILGNEVATLVNEQKSVGTYEVEFNGTGLPSGIYFIRLQAGNFIQTKKMVLMK